MTRVSREFIVHEGASGSFDSSDFINDFMRGVLVFLNVESVGAETITVTIQGKSPVGTDEYYTILASAAITDPGLTVLAVYPGITAAANASVSAVLPATWRISVTVSAATPDFDIAFVYVP